MKANITKEEFIAIVDSAMEQISSALNACEEITDKYISLCCIEDRMFWYTYTEDKKINANKGYAWCDDEWVVTITPKEDKDE